MASKLPSPDVLGKWPDAAEIQRLVDNYPTYEWEHRNRLLHGYFQGCTLRQIVEAKLQAKGIDIGSLSSRSLGGHTRWACKKVNKTFARILYLRYRIDEGLTRIEADERLLDKSFRSTKAKSDEGRSAIRKMTAGAEVDE